MIIVEIVNTYPDFKSKATVTMLVTMRWKITLLSLLIFFYSGCSNNNTIVLDAKFPEPLTKKIPLTIGVVYEEEFKNHLYQEESEVEGEPEWMLNTGKAQVALFNKLLSGVFEKTVAFEKYPDSLPPEVDAIFSPLVEDLQIAIPKITKVNVFEVWIRYNFRIYSPEGDVIADWIMSGYGKTPTRFLETQTQAIEQAAVVALRDGGANFVIGLKNVPEVRRWLESENVLVKKP